ncbi:MAG: SRPBCC domain-containing protein [Bacteroidota bacterium]
MSEKNSSFRQEKNQLIYTRLVNAPCKLVWDAWTDPEQVKEWWGPAGFTLTHHSIDVRAGKEWVFTMHGPEMDFENRILFLEVKKPSLLHYKHTDPDGKITFEVYATFEESEGKTLVTLRSIFESEEVIEELNRQFRILEGGKQHLDNLELYIDNLNK